MTPRRGDLLVTRHGAWFLGRFMPCALGRGGVRSDKAEGDGATPVGPMRILGVLRRPDRMRALATKLPQATIGPRDLWSDDPADPAYNHQARAPHPFRHESLHRPDPLYDLILITDHNYPDAIPGRGSAIFLHRWRSPRYPTAGCITFAAKDLHWIARHWQPRSRIIIRP